MQLAEEHGVKFMETSARTGYNIENVNIKNMNPINSIVAI